jgi:hypothetical protein
MTNNANAICCLENARGEAMLRAGLDEGMEVMVNSAEVLLHLWPDVVRLPASMQMH